MVYKRYIKRNGKTFGPYYYESYRDETGKTRTKLVNIPKKNKFSVKLIYFLIIFSLFLTAGFVILNKNSEKTPDFSSSLIKDIPAKISPGNSKIIGNIIKLIGFQVSQGDDAAEPSENEPPSDEVPEQNAGTESLPDENTEEQITEEKDIEQSEIIEAPAETIKTETEINQTEQITPETSQTEQNFSEINRSETNETEINVQISPKPVTAQNNISNATAEINIINESLQNISEINQTIIENLTISETNQTITENLTISETNQTITENLTISETNQTIQRENFTINENILQYSAKIGQPVKWKKTLKIDAGENKTIINLEVTLPKTAGEVSVKKIFANNSVEEMKVNVANEKIVKETEPTIFITGQFVKNAEKTGILKKIFKFFRNFAALAGRVVDIGENEENVLVNIQEELEDQDEIEIEYFTEAPYSEEIVFHDNYKKINIVGSGEIHYENILAFSNLSKEVSSKNEINLYWFKNNSKELIDFNAFDLDGNGLIDEIEWIVPFLSNQTYELILITKAQHLDSNKNFISDIYDDVRALDGNWSEQINDSEYVRVTFEKNLTNQNDITIYPRAVNGTPRIEVYENNKTELIAEFTNLIDNEYNKVYLTNLNGTQNIFDLKIIGGSVEFDYIVDPFTGPSAGNWMDLSANDTGNWAGTTTLVATAVNTNDNLVYTALYSGKFGVYNHSNGVWMDLSANDTGNWAGTTIVYGTTVNTNNNLVYTGLDSGKFGVYRADIFSGGGAGTLASPYEISDCVQLQNMSLNLNANYELVNNIDCSDTINWNDGAGFSPVGYTSTVNNFFKGSLQGNDYNITNLYIKNTSATGYTGLFGYAINATINKVHLWNAYVEGKNTAIGGLVGAFNDNGTISNSSVHGNVSSKGSSYAGGLAGWVWADKHLPIVYNSSFTGNLSAAGNSGTGGLVGWSDGIINYSFANVKLNSTNFGAGGLVGNNAVDGNEAGIIDNSYALGNVSVAGGSSATLIGGLVGANSGNILHSYSAINVSGNNVVGGLVGNNIANISYSYSCGGDVNADNKIGGLIGTAQASSNASFSYSANNLVAVGANIGGFVGLLQGATHPSLNASFYDFEIDGGNYNDTGGNGNVSGIYANTTAQMKKQSTYTALGWDFSNIWQIAEDYSYPYFKWQTTPACGIPVPAVVVSGSGSGNTPTIIELFSGFKINPTTINVILNKTESKTECFTITSTGTLSVNADLDVVGEIVPFTTLTNSVLQIPVQNSKSACAVFSADEFDIPENYTGQIEVSAKEKKYINVFLEIREINITTANITNVTTGILPVGILDIFGKIGFEGILPLGESFLPPGYKGILPVGTFPIGILPVEQHLPLISKAVVKGVATISLWILLLLLVIIYLTARRFVKLQDQLQGYKSREEKLAMIERIKRNSLRKEANIFEKIIDKGTIYLSEKALDKNAEQKSAKIIKSKPTAEIPSAKKTEPKLILNSLPAYATERYKRGAEFYSVKEYDKALKEFEKAVETDNKFWQGYQGIGSCYLAKSEIEKAKSAFEKSLLINPNNEKLIEWMKKNGMRK